MRKFWELTNPTFTCPFCLYSWKLTLSWLYETVYLVTHWSQHSCLPCVSIPVTLVIWPKSTFSHWLTSLVLADHAPVFPPPALKFNLALEGPWPAFHSDDADIWLSKIVPSSMPSCWLHAACKGEYNLKHCPPNWALLYLSSLSEKEIDLVCFSIFTTSRHAKEETSICHLTFGSFEVNGHSCSYLQNILGTQPSWKCDCSRILDECE